MFDSNESGERREETFFQRDNEQQPHIDRYQQSPETDRPASQHVITEPHKKGISAMLLPLVLGTLLCLGLGGFTGWQIGKSIAPTNIAISDPGKGMTPEQVIAKGRQSVVQINVQTSQGSSLGSGVIIDSRGYIVTNYHVVVNGQHYQVVLFDGSALTAQVTGTDPSDDLAVVKINPPRHLTVMPIGDSSLVQVGDSVLAIGNPLGITQTVTSGIVSALGRTVPESQGNSVIIDAVQTDAAINPGNSGGALVNMRGQLIGIPTLVPLDPEFKTPANGVGFAIPSNRVKFIATQLIENGKVIHSGRPAIGATVTSVDPSVATQANLSVEQGALIVSVTPGGPAAQAGLKADDVIVRVNNTQISNTTDLTDALIHEDPGTTVTLGIVRGRQRTQAKIKLAELTV